MKYKHFRIRNFKGIKDTTVDLGEGPAAIFPLVGLNESGKTTILEAIHSFSPDIATSELVGDKGSGVPVPDRVPRHLISTFTGSISVAATVTVSDNEKDIIEKSLLERHQLQIDKSRIPSEITLDRYHTFEGGDYKSHFLSIGEKVYVKKPRAKKWREPETEAERIAVRDAFYNLTPNIAYFPTFVFEFPKEIYLTDRGSKLDRFYYRVFQDVLDYDNKGHSIETSVVRRVRNENLILAWVDFWTQWVKMEDERNKIQHVMDRAGAVITQVVFKRWNEIFGEDAKGKEVVISYEVVEGTKRDKNGAIVKTDEHDIHIKFQIRDGTRRFDVNDRSLGFRWFFAFMMFTQFRVARKGGSNRPMLFLFDEPASNLHSAAQKKLIDSFPEIVKGEHTLMYTTHSHYMIEPKWLEQTFIVTNRSDAPLDSVLDAVSLDDESLDIKANRYRAFISNHPNKTSYFQPILDRLEVVPSSFDIKHKSVVLEGKSDFYILRYAKILLKKREISLIPGLGAGTFDALIALHIGWNLNFIFILDADKQGLVEKERYEKKFSIPADQIFSIAELEPSLKDIEDLFDKDAKLTIQKEMSLPKEPNKSQILRFCQERLASNTVIDLGPSFSKKSNAMLKMLEQKLK